MFYASKEIRKERLDICKGCEHYHSFLGNCKLCGCFMKVKTAIATMQCADTNNRKWDRIVEVNENTLQVPPEFREEIIELYKALQSGNLNENDNKQRVITLHNTIYGTNYATNTTCSSCHKNVREGINKLYNEIQGDKGGAKE